MKSQLTIKLQAKKTFSWGISSTATNFLDASELQAARDGCDSGSNVSPLAKIKQKPLRKVRRP